MKTVLITGGALRLGALLCQAFAQAGWQVWCHYQRSAAAAQALQQRLQAGGAKVHLVQADLGQATDRARMMQTIEATTGPLDCLVNNASLFEPDTGAAMDLHGTRQQLEVNLIAPLSLASLMAQQDAPDATPGQRSVIHVLDQKVFNLNPDYFSYTVSKLALERSVAGPVERRGVAGWSHRAGSLGRSGHADHGEGLADLSSPKQRHSVDRHCQSVRAVRFGLQVLLQLLEQWLEYLVLDLLGVEHPAIAACVLEGLERFLGRRAGLVTGKHLHRLQQVAPLHVLSVGHDEVGHDVVHVGGRAQGGLADLPGAQQGPIDPADHILLADAGDLAQVIPDRAGHPAAGQVAVALQAGRARDRGIRDLHPFGLAVRARQAHAGDLDRLVLDVESRRHVRPDRARRRCRG